MPRDPRDSKIIAALNDMCRSMLGGFCKVVLTPGVQELGPMEIISIRRQIELFNQFTPDMDPHGEHDFGILHMKDPEGSERVILWKIDYYDVSMLTASPDPTDPKLTKRVLTIMLAHEY